MNNNSYSNNRSSSNNNNNRRRGRGGNNNRQGGQSVNRIDSRARGNAPQMLEKYRKLAHDAHLNGDRVQEEYYLQFADHYFRVQADQRQRQEEQRAPRPEGSAPYRDDSRGSGYGEDGSGDYAAEGDGASYDQQNFNNRDDRGQRDAYRDEAPSDGSAGDTASGDDYAGDAVPETSDNPFLRNQRQPREPRPPREPRRDDARDNPRDGRRNERPRSDEQRPRSDEQRPRREPRVRSEPEAQLGLDPSMLPPAISITRGEEPPVAETVVVTGEAPRRRGRPRKAASDAGETLDSVS